MPKSNLRSHHRAASRTQQVADQVARHIGMPRKEVFNVLADAGIDLNNARNSPEQITAVFQMVLAARQNRAPH